MRIRKFTPSDLQAIQHLFHDTVHAINAKDYSPKQIDTWAPKTPSATWDTIQENICIVAEINGTIVGFGDVTEKGYVDRLYTHKDFQNLGIGSQILKRLEHHARQLGLKEVYTESSITAKTFFERHGYILLKSQKKTFRGTNFQNYVMLKSLA